MLVNDYITSLSIVAEETLRMDGVAEHNFLYFLCRGGKKKKNKEQILRLSNGGKK